MSEMRAYYKKAQTNVLDKTALFLGSSVLATTFCVNEMLMSNETTNEEISKYIPDALKDATQDYIRRMLEDPEFDGADQKAKETTIESSWPLYIIKAVLEKYGLSEESMSYEFPTKILEDDIAEYCEDLTEINNACYFLIINHMGVTESQMPVLLIMKAYEYICEHEGFEDGKALAEWLPLAIAAIPPKEYTAIMNGTYPKPEMS